MRQHSSTEYSTEYVGLSDESREGKREVSRTTRCLPAYSTSPWPRGELYYRHKQKRVSLAPVKKVRQVRFQAWYAFG